GLDVRCDVDYRQVGVQAGDVFCLSTDGLHEHVAPADIVAAANSAGDFADLAETLTRRALDQGSADNVTAVLLRVDDLGGVSEADVLRHFSQLPFPPELGSGMSIDGYRIEREIESSRRSQLYLVSDEQTGG